MKFFVKSFGCRTNQAELQKWIRNLESSGYNFSTDIRNCQFGILNTCSLTNKAEGKTVRYLKKHFMKYQDIPCVVTGCTVSKEKERLEGEFNTFIFINNRDKGKLVELIKNRFSTSSNLIYSSVYRSRYFLKIQDGCNFSCSYCIIPSLRGKSRSIPIQELIKELNLCTTMGYHEVVITGINISSYGYDLFPRENLLNLIGKMSEIDMIKLIRISSLDPRIINFTFVKKICSLKKVARSFHISFQSGSNSVLRQMKRSGKRSDYLKIMKDFSSCYPDANFGTDIIVGFPGETNKDFLETLDFVKNSGLNYIHIFPFSPMENTKAYYYPPVPNHIVMKRVRELREVNKQLKINYRERIRNTIWDAVIVQEKRNDSFALTSNYLKVRIDRLPGFKKKMIRVKIKGIINENLCEGERVTDLV